MRYRICVKTDDGNLMPFCIGFFTDAALAEMQRCIFALRYPDRVFVVISY